MCVQEKDSMWSRSALRLLWLVGILARAGAIVLPQGTLKPAEEDSADSGLSILDVWSHREIQETSNCEWVQIGGDIVGASEFDHFGDSTALSADGYTLAVGAPRDASFDSRTGYVIVLTYDPSFSEGTGNRSFEELILLPFSGEEAPLNYVTLLADSIEAFDYVQAPFPKPQLQKEENSSEQKSGMTKGAVVAISVIGCTLLMVAVFLTRIRLNGRQPRQSIIEIPPENVIPERTIRERGNENIVPVPDVKDQCRPHQKDPRPDP